MDNQIRRLLSLDVMKMLADSRQLIQQLAPIVSEQDRILRQYEPVIRAMSEQVNQFAKALRPLDVSRLLEQVAWAQKIEESQRVEKAFEAAGFVPSLSMDRGLVTDIVEAHENGEDDEALAQRVLDFYDEDSCERLVPIIEHLCESSDLDGRQATLRHTLEAHRARLDSITTYPLVAMIEGVLLPYLDSVIGPEEIKELLKDNKKKTVTHNTLAAVLTEMPAAVADKTGWEAFGCLLSFFENHLYHSCDWKTNPKALNDIGDLNRHSLLHGMVSQGTRLNTLRCVFILDLVADFLPALRAEFCESDHPSA